MIPSRIIAHCVYCCSLENALIWQSIYVSLLVKEPYFSNTLYFTCASFFVVVIFFFHKIRFSRQRKNVISKIFQNHSKHQSHCSKLFAFYPIFFILWPSWNFISCSLNKYFCYQKCIAIFGVHSVWFTFFYHSIKKYELFTQSVYFFSSV